MDLVEYFQECVAFAQKGRPVQWEAVASTLFNGFISILKERDKLIAEKDAEIARLLAANQQPATDETPDA